jgi:lysozyme family protein
MKGNFDRCLALLFGDEGGYANDPNDNGGPTNFGITQAALNAWRAEQGEPTAPVRTIKRDEAQRIYRSEYWDVVRADELPAGVDYMVFDGAVNSGPARSVKWLQQALGVKIDGAIGPVTIAAAAKADAATLIKAMQSIRMAFLRAHEDWPHFGRGWTNRVDSVVKDALAMVASSPPTTAPPRKPVPTPQPAPVPQPIGFWARLLALLNRIFRRA